MLSGKEVDLDELYPVNQVEAKAPVKVPAYKNSRKVPQTARESPLITDSIITLAIREQSDQIQEDDPKDPAIIEYPSILARWNKVIPYRTKHIPASLPEYRDYALKNVSYLDSEHGLNSPIVRAILQDRNGNIWFGTEGGVYIYNGTTYQLLSAEEGLAGNVVSCLLEDRNENIWIAANGRLHLFDGDSIYIYTYKEGLRGGVINSLLEDSSGNLWITYNRDGITRFDGDTFTTFLIEPGLSPSDWNPVDYKSDFAIHDIEEDHQGNLWFATWGLGALRFDGRNFKFFDTSTGIHNDYLNAITVDSQGRLWFGSTEGISVYNGTSYTHYRELEGLSSSYVTDLFMDKGENIWIGTSGEGICKYNGEEFEYFSEDEGLSTNFVNSIYEDNAGNIWLGSMGSGVGFISKKNLTHFTEKQGLSHPVVFSIIEDSKKLLWFGTRGGGVNQFDGESFTRYTSEGTGLGNNYVLSIMEDSRGNMWFGTYGNGVSRYDGETFTIANKYNGLSDYSINCMLEDREGNYWFGTYRGGLTKLDGTRIVHYTWEEASMNLMVNAMLEDSKANLWIASYPGVKRIKNDSITHFTEKEGLIGNNVRCIMEDRHGNMWFGTTKGISVFNGHFFVNFTGREGLASSDIKTISEDKKGEIWISTVNGLSRMVFSTDVGIFNGKDSSVSPPLVINYNKQDGLNGVNFFHNAVIDSKNQIWFGSGINLTSLDLNSFIINPEPPEVQLNRIDIEDRALDYRYLQDNSGREIKYSRVARYKNYPVDLDIPYKKNHLTFHFSAIDWSAPHKLLYSYKIDGVDNTWSTPSSETKADYRNLPHGSFTFKVSAIGESQVWSDPLVYKFTVSPPWHDTWAARISYVLFILALILVSARWRTAKLKQRQIELESKIAIATQEIREQKEEVESQRDEIEAQRDEIETQREQLKIQRDVVVSQKNEIIDSISYAERIQSAMLPPETYISELLNENFIFYKPRDIVSGDFYWIKQVNQYVVVVAADCTGHGVPGAFMSMLGISYLTEIVQRREITQANQVLEELRKQIKNSLRQHGDPDEAKDGIDLALCVLDQKRSRMQYAGANNSLYLIRDTDGKPELKEVKADRMPLGYYQDRDRPFTNHEIDLEPGDTFYLFSDGFIDQKGGRDNKRYMKKAFKSLLMEIHDRSMPDQKGILDKKLTDWMGNNPQTDDILVIGVRV